MRRIRELSRSPGLPAVALVAASLLAGPAARAQSAAPASRGVLLADLTWVEAERRLTPEAIVVIPLGAEAKEHGPHLRLDNDFVMAQYLRDRVHQAADVVIAPTVNYHFYPSFVDYPGSTHLEFDTAVRVIVDIVRGLAAFGPKRFYVLNTGVSTVRPLTAAADSLRARGITMAFTNILEVAGPAEQQVKQQAEGTHADEIETSMMLYIAPDRVDMSKAAKDGTRNAPGPLRRVRDRPGLYSPTGIFGDATLATREKGRVVVEATVAGILAEIERLRGTPVPR